MASRQSGFLDLRIISLTVGEYPEAAAVARRLNGNTEAAEADGLGAEYVRYQRQLARRSKSEDCTLSHQSLESGHRGGPGIKLTRTHVRRYIVRISTISNIAGPIPVVDIGSHAESIICCNWYWGSKTGASCKDTSISRKTHLAEWAQQIVDIANTFNTLARGHGWPLGLQRNSGGQSTRIYSLPISLERSELHSMISGIGIRVCFFTVVMVESVSKRHILDKARRTELDRGNFRLDGQISRACVEKGQPRDHCSVVVGPEKEDAIAPTLPLLTRQHRFRTWGEFNHSSTKTLKVEAD